MATARSELVDVHVRRWYRFINRCVRRVFLLGEGTFDRKAWEKRNVAMPVLVCFVGMFVLICPGLFHYCGTPTAKCRETSLASRGLENTMNSSMTPFQFRTGRLSK
jgi:hypothetical protein